MYKNRPSKQQQRKGMELMKNLIMSHKNINQHSNTNINSQDPIWSSTSLMTISKMDKKEVNQSSFHKIDHSLVQSAQLISLTHKDHVMNPKNKDNPQMGKTAVGNNFGTNQGKVFLKESKYLKNSYHQQMVQTKKGQMKKDSNRIRTQTNQSISHNLKQWFSKSSQKQQKTSQKPQVLLKSESRQQLKQSKFAIPLTRSLSKQDRLTQTKRQSKNVNNAKLMQQLFLPIKGSSSSLIQIPKLAPHYKKAKEKTTFENVYKLQKELVIQREQIKKVRREFMEVLQNGKKFMAQYEKDLEQISNQQSFIHSQLQKFDRQTMKRGQSKMVLEEQLLKIESQLRQEKQAHNRKKSQLQEQIMSRQQQNSSMARRIYQLKTHLNSAHQHRQKLNSIDQKNKSLVKNIIKKQQTINQLKEQRSQMLQQKKQRQREFIRQEIQNQDKTQIYERLDTQLNLIKEYFKISQNAKEFKKNIKKLTQFDSFHKQVQAFTKSIGYSEEIMLLYRLTLWNTEMPKFFQSQPLILESPKIRQLKNTYKQLELKRQSLNEFLKEKQKVVDSLTYRCQKLIEQIEHLQGKNEQVQGNDQNELFSQNRETINRINWGFR